MIAQERMTSSGTIATIRPRLFSIAYRMMGSVSEAEDVVQEALLRHQRALKDGAEIDSPIAYLTTVTTRLAIDELRSARMRREMYVGNWFPEPILTDRAEGDPAELAEQSESLSMAFLLLLERLTPVERAVFLLHDVFGYGFDEVAEIVGKSAANCRQLALRARRHIEAGKPRFEASRAKRNELSLLRRGLRGGPRRSHRDARDRRGRRWRRWREGAGLDPADYRRGASGTALRRPR